MQIFEVLREVGRYHDFTAGVITGGKKGFREEQIVSVVCCWRRVFIFFNIFIFIFIFVFI